MTSPRIYTFSVFEESAATAFARILNPETGLPIVPADVASISYKMFDKTTGLEEQGGPLVVADVVFDPLKTTDPRWTADNIGYNFAWTIPAAYFATSGTTYRIELTFTPTAGEIYHVVYEAQVADLLTY